jgi:rubrerythrin
MSRAKPYVRKTRPTKKELQWLSEDEQSRTKGMVLIEQMFRGKEIIKQVWSCPICRGHGFVLWVQGMKPDKCLHCDGHGAIGFMGVTTETNNNKHQRTRRQVFPWSLYNGGE